jgi:DNA primase
VYLASADALGRDVYAMRLSDELGVSKDAILQHIKEAAKREQYRKSKSEFSDAQKKAQEMEKNVDPQRVKNMRAARAEDIILITLLNNGSFYKEFKDRLKSDIFFTPVNKKIFEVISQRLEDGERIDISHLSQFLTSDETGAVARLLSRQSMVSNTLKECEDCLNVLEDEKRKRETSNPSQMSDDSFLAFFSSLKKDE